MEPTTAGRDLSPDEQENLLAVLQERFEANTDRHADLAWADVRARLDAHPEKLQPLNEMERTGGEPDVIARGEQTGDYVFCDCAPESPEGRRSLCYDREALDSRKANKPADSVVDAAAAMGVELLNEEQYRELQLLGEFDVKTSSWVATPSDVRTLGGALFCDRRYGRVFVYHNGAQSYYAVRGFRGLLRV